MPDNLLTIATASGGFRIMDRLYIRTCSSDQALVLAQADGQCFRVGSSQVRVHRPAGRLPIDPRSDTRYAASIEVLDTGPSPAAMVGGPAVEVVADLFGPYLD